MATALLTVALAAYAAATAAFLALLATRRPVLGAAGLAVAGAGLAIHFVSYGLDCAATHAMVVMSTRGSFSLLALLTVAVMLGLAARHALHILGAFVLPFALLATGIAAFAPLPGPPPEALRGALFPLHVITSYLGFAGFAAAFGVAIAYLVQEAELKSRKPQAVTFVLPSLDVLDRLGAGVALAGLAALAAGILTGVLFEQQTAHVWWTGEPKAVATLVSGAIYAVAFLLRSGFGWRGRRTAWLLIAGFLLALFTFAGLGHVPVKAA